MYHNVYNWYLTMIFSDFGITLISGSPGMQLFSCCTLTWTIKIFFLHSHLQTIDGYFSKKLPDLSEITNLIASRCLSLYIPWSSIMSNPPFNNAVYAIILFQAGSEVNSKSAKRRLFAKLGWAAHCIEGATTTSYSHAYVLHGYTSDDWAADSVSIVSYFSLELLL